MRRERMAHRVAGGAIWNPGLADCVFKLALHGGFVQVVAGDPSGARMGAEGGGCENVLKAPLAAGVWPFAQQGFRHMDVPRANGKVLKIFLTKAEEMLIEPRLQGYGQGVLSFQTAWRTARFFAEMATKRKFEYAVSI